MKHFYSVDDVASLEALLDSAAALKRTDRQQLRTLGSGKTLVLIFFNPSLRTRLSTELAGQLLGMQVITMSAKEAWGWELQEGAVMNADKAEHVKDAARVISQYADVIGIRSFPSLADRDADYRDELLKSFVQHSQVPVVSLESSLYHPLQSLTDWLTISEHAPRDRKLKVVATWAPHPRALPQAVVNSFCTWSARTQHELVLAHPQGYELAPDITEAWHISHDQDEALADADVVYVKNWSSYERYGEVLSQDPAWMITPEKLALTRNARLLHCLPVRRNVVISDAALDGPQSLVIEQAGNRTWAAAAVLQSLLAA